MSDQLLYYARRYADAHADRNGVASTPVPGLVIVRETGPTMLQYAVSKPLVALVLQGGKCVTIGSRAFDLGAGDSLFITTDVPTVSQITTASRVLPYYSLVLELDPAIIADLVSVWNIKSSAHSWSMRVVTVDATTLTSTTATMAATFPPGVSAVTIAGMGVAARRYRPNTLNTPAAANSTSNATGE